MSFALLTEHTNNTLAKNKNVIWIYSISNSGVIYMHLVSVEENTS